jgi:hypothetical protein
MERLNRLLAVATGVAGMVVYVYVLGGLVVWARLTASRLYTDSAVNALGSNSLRELKARGLPPDADVELPGRPSIQPVAPGTIKPSLW